MKPLLITMGDAAGIGPELIAKAWPQRPPGPATVVGNTVTFTGANVVLNDLSIGRYDVVIDAGPGYSTRRMEAADGMIQLAQAAPQALPVLIPRIAKSLDWPDATEIGDEIKQAFAPPPPQADPINHRITRVTHGRTVESET